VFSNKRFREDIEFKFLIKALDSYISEEDGSFTKVLYVLVED